MTTKDVTLIEYLVCQADSRYDFSSRDLMFDHYQRYDYFKCSECESVFQNPMPTPQQINSFYPEDYSIFDQASQLRKVNVFKQAILSHKYGYRHLKTTAKFELLAKAFSPLWKKRGDVIHLNLTKK
jgi:hypothetical protein